MDSKSRDVTPLSDRYESSMLSSLSVAYLLSMADLKSRGFSIGVRG